MMLSHDWNVVLSRIGTSGFPGRDENPDGYLWLSRHFIPKLMEMGVKQDTIDRMMVENPRRHFESVKPTACNCRWPITFRRVSLNKLCEF